MEAVKKVKTGMLFGRCLLQISKSKAWVQNMSMINACGVFGIWVLRNVLTERRFSRTLRQRRVSKGVWSLTNVERSTGGRSMTWKLGGRLVGV